MTTNPNLDALKRELDDLRKAMNSPRIGLFAMRKAYRRHGELLRQIDALEIDAAIDHVNGGDISAQPTVYRQG